MYASKLAILVLTVGNISAQNFSQDLRIVGGREAQKGQFPYQVALQIDETFSTVFCGGSLISDRYVLTSAHCLIKAVKVTAILGTTDLQDSNRVTVESSDIIPHDDYESDDFLYDIGLVQLTKPVSETPGLIEYIKLTQSGTNYDNKQAVTAGWGLTSDQDSSGSQKLLYIESKVLSNDDCKKIDPFGTIVHTSHVCLSGSGGVGACTGDSGGPLVVDGVQIGIYSFGYRSCTESKPSVFTRVSEHLDWIKDNTN